MKRMSIGILLFLVLAPLVSDGSSSNRPKSVSKAESDCLSMMDKMTDEGVQNDGFIGKKILSEKTTWIDDTTGYEITQWTSIGENNHPYFTVESFIDNDNIIIFSKRTGTRQLYRLNLLTGEMIQMTNASKLSSIDHLPKYENVWYIDDNTLFVLNTRTFEVKEVYNFNQQSFHVKSISVTCDAKWFIFSVIKQEQSSNDCAYGPYAIYKLNLETKEIEQITLDLGFNVSHIQANPVDPNIILYCWQWEKPGRPLLVGHAPIRTWWVNLAGTDGGPFLQEYGTQRTHEAWTPDGRCITFVSKYRIGPNKGKHFFGIQSIDGTVNQRYYEQVSPGHQNIYKDNKHWIVDVYNNDEQLLALFTRGESIMENKEVLFRHGSSLEGQNSHPHPRFSPDGKYVVFSTDKTGTPQVYTVRVEIASGKK